MKLLVSAVLATTVSATAPLVDLLVCTESLCGGCQDFVTTDLAKAINNTEIAAITNLTAVPFGNAKYNRLSGKVTCQHGELECVGNNWEQCAIAHHPKVSDWFPFYYCIEKNGEEGVTKLPTQMCATLSGLDHDDLETCVNGEEGKALQKKAWQQTPDDHQYVPWVVINGKTWNQEGSLTKALCKAYKEGGGTEPTACVLEEKESDDKVDGTRFSVDMA